MTLHVRFATGFRWRPTRLSAAPSDLVRVLEDDGVHLALMANAYDGAFATCWPAGSRMILDLFVQAWRETTGRFGSAWRALPANVIERPNTVSR